jgi:hypothetical protein
MDKMPGGLDTTAVFLAMQEVEVRNSRQTSRQGDVETFSSRQDAPLPKGRASKERDGPSSQSILG